MSALAYRGSVTSAHYVSQGPHAWHGGGHSVGHGVHPGRVGHGRVASRPICLGVPSSSLLTLHLHSMYL